MSGNELRIALVGAGKIAESFHLPAWREVAGARITCLVDPRGDAAQALAQRFQIPKTYPSIEAMLAGEGAAVDGVDVCSPNAMHADHVVQCLAAGKHVVVEKPFATTYADAQRMKAAAERAGRVLLCALHQRFRPPTEKAMALIQEGALGEVYWVRAEGLKARSVPVQNGSFTSRALAGGGPLLDIGSHLLDVAWWLMGNPEPESFFCQTMRRLVDEPEIGAQNRLGPWKAMEVEEAASAMVRFRGGKSLSLSVSYLLNTPAEPFQLSLYGTKASLEWPQLRLARWREGEVRAEPVEFSETHRASVAELSHFIALVRGLETSRISLQDSVAVVRMIECLYQSAESGQAVLW